MATPGETKTRFPRGFPDGAASLVRRKGFYRRHQKSRFAIWACSILPQHIHLVIARHHFKVEYIVGLLKGEATKAMNQASMHPLGDHKTKEGKPPTPWNAKSYHGFLETEREIEDAIAYVIGNPEKEGKRRQHWKCVTPFAGLDEGLVSYGG